MTATFTIDTGTERSAIDYVPGWFLDQYDTVPDERRVVHDWAYHLIGALAQPRTMATVRKHTLAQWHFLRILADQWPDVFDEFWSAYAERWTRPE